MDAHLPGLPCAAGKQGTEDGDIEAALHGAVYHLHVGGVLGRLGLPALALLLGGRGTSGAAAGGMLAAVVSGEVARVHVDNAGKAAAEHALPLPLADVLAVVGARGSLGHPFLLEEGFGSYMWFPEPGEVKEVVLVPCLSDALRGGKMVRDVPVGKQGDG